MSTFKLIHRSCADQNVDAVVNAANSGLWKEVKFAVLFLVNAVLIN